MVSLRKVSSYYLTGLACSYNIGNNFPRLQFKVPRTMFKIMCYQRTHKPAQRYTAYILDIGLAKLKIAYRSNLNTDFIESHVCDTFRHAKRPYVIVIKRYVIKN